MLRRAARRAGYKRWPGKSGRYDKIKISLQNSIKHAMTITSVMESIIFGLILTSCSSVPAVPPHTVISTGNENQLRKARVIQADISRQEGFQIELPGQVIEADKDGHLISGPLKKTINLGEFFYTRLIHYYDHDKQVILFFEITDDEVGSNAVYCLDKQTLQTVWTTNLFSFNLSVGQAEAGILYLGAGENAYALDTGTGKIPWETTGLYHIYGFNAFDSIALVGNEIHLTGESSSKTKEVRTKTAILDKKDGRILSVK